MKVYIVIKHTWDYSSIQGVFSTESKAKRWKQVFEEECGWSADSDWRLEIGSWVVDGALWGI